MRLYIVIAVLTIIACGPVVEEPSVDTPTPIVVVVTATPTSTPILPTPTPTPSPVPTVTPLPSPTAVPVDDILHRIWVLNEQLSLVGVECGKLIDSGTCGHISECEKAVSLLQEIRRELGFMRDTEHVGGEAGTTLMNLAQYIFSEDTDNYMSLLGGGIVGDSPIDTTNMDLPEILQAVSVAVPAVITDDGTGSGTLIEDGVIVTNAHVVGDNYDVVVRFERGCEFRARVVKRDVGRDIALLRMYNAPNMSHLTLSEDIPRRGEEVLVFGYPLGDRLGTEVKMTKGTITALLQRTEEPHVGLIQTDAVINRGNSGGPMLNMNGEVIGIVTEKYSGLGIEGIGLAVMSREVDVQ